MFALQDGNKRLPIFYYRCDYLIKLRDKILSDTITSRSRTKFSDCTIVVRIAADNRAQSTGRG